MTFSFRKLKKNYYTTGTAYLRSRVKLHEQNQLLSAIPGNTYAPKGSGAGPGHNPSTYVPPTDSRTGSQSFHSTQCITDPSACCSSLDGSFCAVNVTYKPSNPVFSAQGAVSSGTRILDIRRRAIVTNNQDLSEVLPNGKKANLRENGQELPGSTPILYRGETVAPYFIKSKFQSINDISLIMSNKTRVGAKMPSGGTGIKTVCVSCTE